MISDHTKDLLRNTRDLEERLKSLKDRPGDNLHEISRISLEVRGCYQNVILESPVYAVSKSIDVLLWKNSFYRKIEEYRKSIKRTTEHIEEIEAVPSRSSVVLTNLNKLQHHLLQTSSLFNTFLSESSSFYQEFLIQLEGKLHGFQQEKGILFAKANDNVEVTALEQCIHRCLLYLGDISRYKELHSDRRSREKDWSIAKKYYERAYFTLPLSGNPHNQLAVLATYIDSDCTALYHYCCSILAELPFTAGPENMGILLDRIAKSLPTQTTNGSDNLGQIDTRGHILDQSNTHNTKRSPKLRPFFHKYLYLFSTIFRLCTVIKDTDNNNTETTPLQPHPHPLLILTPRGIENYLNQLVSVMDEFGALLVSSSSFPEHALLEMIVIGIFFVHYPRFSFEKPLESLSTDVINPVIQSPLTRQEQTPGVKYCLAESLSLITLFNFMNKICVRFSNLVDERGEKKWAALQRLLPACAVFCDWAEIHPHYFKNTTRNVPQSTPVTASTSVIEVQGSKYPYLQVSDSEILRTVDRARSGAKCTLAMIKNDLEKISTRFLKSAIENVDSSLPLKEHLELLGFLPLHYRKRYQEKGFIYSKESTSFCTDTLMCNKRRLFSLKQLIESDLLSIASAPPAPSTSEHAFRSDSNRGKEKGQRRRRGGRKRREEQQQQFEGSPESGSRSRRARGGQRFHRGKIGGSEEGALPLTAENLRKKEELHPGWIPSTNGPVASDRRRGRDVVEEEEEEERDISSENSSEKKEDVDTEEGDDVDDDDDVEYEDDEDEEEEKGKEEESDDEEEVLQKIKGDFSDSSNLKSIPLIGRMVQLDENVNDDVDNADDVVVFQPKFSRNYHPISSNSVSKPPHSPFPSEEGGGSKASNGFTNDITTISFGANSFSSMSGEIGEVQTVRMNGGNSFHQSYPMSPPPHPEQDYSWLGGGNSFGGLISSAPSPSLSQMSSSNDLLLSANTHNGGWNPGAGLGARALPEWVSHDVPLSKTPSPALHAIGRMTTNEQYHSNSFLDDNPVESLPLTNPQQQSHWWDSSPLQQQLPQPPRTMPAEMLGSYVNVASNNPHYPMFGNDLTSSGMRNDFLPPPGFPANNNHPQFNLNSTGSNWMGSPQPPLQSPMYQPLNAIAPGPSMYPSWSGADQSNPFINQFGEISFPDELMSSFRDSGTSDHGFDTHSNTGVK